MIFSTMDTTLSVSIFISFSNTRRFTADDKSGLDGYRNAALDFFTVCSEDTGKIGDSIS